MLEVGIDEESRIAKKIRFHVIKQHIIDIRKIKKYSQARMVVGLFPFSSESSLWPWISANSTKPSQFMELIFGIMKRVEAHDAVGDHAHFAEFLV